MIDTTPSASKAAELPTQPIIAHKRWLPWGEAAAGFHLLISLLIFIIGTPVFFDILTTPCEANCLYFLQLKPTEAETLLTAGLSMRFYALYQIGQEVLYLITFSIIGGVIYAKLVYQRAAQAWYGLLTAFALISLGTILLSETSLSAATLSESWLFLYELLKAIAFMAFLAFCLLFPNGRFVPSWSQWALATAGIWMVIWVFFPLPELDPARSQGTYPNMAMLLVIVGTQIYRYMRVSTPIQRQQTKWFVFGFGLVLTAVVLWSSLFLLFAPPPGLSRLIGNLVGQGVLALFPIAFAVCISISLLRYRLWDIDLIINRMLVYGGLTVTIVAVYSLLVGGLGAIVQFQNNFVLSLLATGFIAVLFHPVRERFQRAANRLMFGERDAPLDLLARLGQILASADAPSAILPTYAQTIAESLLLPFVAIWLREGEQSFSQIAAYGQPPEPVEMLPLLYHGQPIGQLVVALRVGQTSFNRADQRLLNQIAQQTAAAVNTVRLTRDLQQSREHIVTTREEERRRLRRDLHDGLGPVLASQGLKLSAARQLLVKKPATAEQLLREVITQNEQTVTEVRRLIYELRPPTLDDLGLVAAVREGCEKLSRSCRYTVQAAPDPLPELPAAVEVAAYRIIMEAATNVSRHAQATDCEISLTVEPSHLRLFVTDNGRGLPANRPTGVGLTSMRERAAELGGNCTVEPAEKGGTVVSALLPILNS